MNNFAKQLKDRLLKTYEEKKKQELDNFKLYQSMLDVCNVMLQELEQHVTKYKMIKNENDEVVYYKYAQPHILQYKITFDFLATANRRMPFGTPKMKAKYLKSCFEKLNDQFKKKNKTIAC
jgi:hypothetical protein